MFLYFYLLQLLVLSCLNFFHNFYSLMLTSTAAHTHMLQTEAGTAADAKEALHHVFVFSPASTVGPELS